MATQVYLSKYTGAQIDALLDRASALSTAAGATVGSATKPIYLASGALTASGTTVGGAAKPIYLSSGNMTACSSTVGSAASSGVMTPVYMNAGTMTSCGATTYTAAQVDSLLSSKAASSHTHDDRYYTESEVNSLLSNKAAYKSGYCITLDNYLDANAKTYFEVTNPNYAVATRIGRTVIIGGLIHTKAAWTGSNIKLFSGLPALYSPCHSYAGYAGIWYYYAVGSGNNKMGLFYTPDSTSLTLWSPVSITIPSGQWVAFQNQYCAASGNDA